MANELLTLDTAALPQEEPQLSLDLGQPTTTPSTTTAASRATKAIAGKSIVDRPFDAVYQDILNGHEQQLRASAASNIDMQKAQAAQDFISDVARAKKGALSPTEAQFIKAKFDVLNTPTDPKSVFEEKYAKEYMGKVKQVAAETETFFNDAMREQPANLQKTLDLGEGLVAKQQYAHMHKQDAEEAVHKQSYFGYGVDFLKTAVPFYSQVKMRGLGDVSFWKGIGVGSNLQETVTALYKLPFSDFKENVDKIMTKLKNDNPQKAVEFADYLVGASTSKRVLDDFFSLLDFTVVPAGKLTGALKRQVELSNKVNTAIGQHVAASTPEVIAGRAAESAGDSIGGAAAKISDEVIQNLKGVADPDKETLSALFSNKITDAIALEKGLTTDRVLGPGVYNYIKEMGNKFYDKLGTAIVSTMKIARIPGLADNPELMEHVFKKFAGEIQTDFKGAQILDQKYRKDPVGNIGWVDNHIVQPDGSLFKSPQAAKAFATARGVKDPIVAKQTFTTVTSVDTKVSSFRTAKGSTYEVRADGTTVRNKALRNDPGHEGDQGIKPASVKTVYLTEEAANRLAPPQGQFRIIDHGDGTLSTATPSGKSFQWGISDTQRNVKYSTEPSVGSTPLELWGQGSLKGQTSFNNLHFGNKIIEVSGASNAKIEQQGLGYKLIVSKPVVETEGFIRDHLIETANSQPTKSWLNTFVGKFITPNETLSSDHNVARLIATTAPSNYMAVVKEVTRDINKLKSWSSYVPGSKANKQWHEWDKMMTAMREATGPDGESAVWVKSPSDVTQFYMRHLGRLPSEQEVAATFAYRNNLEANRMFQEIGEYRDRARVGAAQHRFVQGIPAEGKVTYSNWFDGTKLYDLPVDSGNMLITSSEHGNHKLVALESYRGKARTSLANQIKEGKLQLIEVYREGDRPLVAYTDKTVKYVLTPTAETKALGWNHVPRNKVQLLDTEYNWYIAQAKVTREEVGKVVRHLYEGDTKIMAAAIRSVGTGFAEKLDKVRQLIKSGRETEARILHNDTLPMNWDDTKRWFDSGKLNLDEKIQLIQSDKRIGDMDNTMQSRLKGFRDLTRRDAATSGRSRDIDPDLKSIAVEGTKSNPLYRLDPAKFINPIAAMDRSLTRAVNSAFLDDYKLFSVEHWLEKAKNYLNVRNSVEEVRQSPLHFFHSGLLKSDMPADLKQQLENERFHIKQLVGTPSNLEGMLHSFGQDLFDSIYNKLGPKAIPLDPTFMLSSLKDPFRFIRSVTFHEKLGLFSIPQLWTQMAGFTNIYGIAGFKYAAPATKAAFLHELSRINSNPEILAHLDNLATKQLIPGTARWRPGEFTEAREIGQSTGFFNIAKEHALRDSRLTPQLIDSAGGRLLDAGSIFFNEGERFASRYGAWYTAFKEYRDKVKPTGALTDADKRKIFERADILSNNMTAASNSLLNKGIASIPTQFLTYQLRLAELMFGKRLTSLEKARLLAWNSAMYGVPVGAGVYGFPFNDYTPFIGGIRQAAMERYGYVPQDNILADTFMLGLPNVIGALVTGGGDFEKGISLNFGEKFGARGMDIIREGMSSDATFLKLLGGAAGSSIVSGIGHSAGFFKAMGNMVAGNSDYFGMTGQHINDVFREASSVNKATQLYYGINAGRWYNRNDTYVDDVTAGQAVFQYLSGLQRQQASDVQQLRWSKDRIEEGQKLSLNRFVLEFRRGLRAQETDPEVAKTHFANAMAWLESGDYPKEKYNQAIAIAAKDHESQIQRMNWDYYTKDVPQSQKLPFYNALTRRLQITRK